MRPSARLRAIARAIAALDARGDAIAVHGIVHLVRRNEKIAVEILARLFGNDESVAVAVSDQTADDGVRIGGENSGSVTPGDAGGCPARRSPFSLAVPSRPPWAAPGGTGPDAPPPPSRAS